MHPYWAPYKMPNTKRRQVVFAGRKLTDGTRGDETGPIFDPVVWDQLCQSFVHGKSALPRGLTGHALHAPKQHSVVDKCRVLSHF